MQLEEARKSRMDAEDELRSTEAEKSKLETARKVLDDRKQKAVKRRADLEMKARQAEERLSTDTSQREYAAKEAKEVDGAIKAANTKLKKCALVRYRLCFIPCCSC